MRFLRALFLLLRNLFWLFVRNLFLAIIYLRNKYSYKSHNNYKYSC